MVERSLGNQAERSPFPVRVLVCAVDLVARMGLTALLQADDRLTVAGQCTPHDDLVAALALFAPDVVLWDLGWSAADTLATLSEFVDDGPPVLALIADEEDAVPVWATGVRGLLFRDGGPGPLSAALVALSHNLYLFDPAFVGTATPLAIDALRVEPLTPREMDVLQAMAQGLPNKLIARDLAISEHTVKFHINAILGKLGAQSRTDAVVRATRAGLIRL